MFRTANYCVMTYSLEGHRLSGTGPIEPPPLDQKKPIGADATRHKTVFTRNRQGGAWRICARTKRPAARDWRDEKLKVLQPYKAGGFFDVNLSNLMQAGAISLKNFYSSAMHPACYEITRVGAAKSDRSQVL